MLTQIQCTETTPINFTATFLFKLSLPMRAHPQWRRLQTPLMVGHCLSVHCMNMVDAHPQRHRLQTPLMVELLLSVHCMNMVDAHPQWHLLQTPLMVGHCLSVHCMNMVDAHPQQQRLKTPLMVLHFQFLHCRNMVEVSHVPLLLSVKNGIRYLIIIKDDMRKGRKRTSWDVVDGEKLSSVTYNTNFKLG